MYFLVVLAVLLAAVSATTYPVVTNGAYCTQSAGMTVQSGTYTVNACGDKCASQNFLFFTQVPSSSQCLCSNVATNQLVNPGADCYSIPAPGYTECADGSYCGPNGSIVTQPGVYADADACYNQCKGSYNYFNRVVNGQCQCTNTCTLIRSQSVKAYAVNPNSCPSAPSLRN